jgi:hypothetical protein
MIDMLRRFDDRVHLIDKAGQKTTHAPPNKIDSGTSVDLGPAKDITKVVIDALNDGRSTEGVLIHEQLVEYLWNQHRTPGHRNWIEREPASTSNESAIMQNTFRDAITESLTFETIEGREEAIPKAFEKTFSWIFFREPRELYGKKLWSSFPEWLEGNAKQPFWITGKRAQENQRL